MITAIVELVLGLGLIYILLSLLVMALTEWWAHLSAARGRTLRRGIAALLGEAQGGILTDAILNHALVSSLKRGSRLPAYIPGHTFTLALFDLLVNGRDPGLVERQPVHSVDQLLNAARDRSTDLFPKPLLQQLCVLLELSQNYEEAQLVVEHWFNDSMARVCGWYKRRTQLVILLIALVVAVLLNFDTLLIAHRLSMSDAEGLGWSCLYDCESGDLSALQPIRETDFWVLKVIGWLMTAVAISIGAPLVFDLLARVMHVRTTGKRHQ